MLNFFGRFKPSRGVEMKMLFRPLLISTFLFLILTNLSFAQTMPLPTGLQPFMDLTSGQTPILSSDPAAAMPFGISSGETLQVDLGLVAPSGPADLSILMNWSGMPDSFFWFDPDDGIIPFSLAETGAFIATGARPAGADPWMSGINGPVDSRLLAVPMSALPPGSFSMFAFLSPAIANTRNGVQWASYLWVTSFGNPYSSPAPGGMELEQDTTIDTWIFSDPSVHGPHVGLCTACSCKVTRPPCGQSGPIVFDCDGSPLDSMQGTMNQDCSFTASNTGTVAGFPGILGEIDGQFSGPIPRSARRRANMNLPDQAAYGEGFTGAITFGGNGGLPGGQPIVYNYGMTLPYTTSNVSGSAPAGSAWLLITADKDAAVACSFTAPTTSCLETSTADFNLGGTPTIVSRYLVEGSIFDVKKSYFHFTLPTLPAGTTIESAFINLMDVENSITPSQDTVPVGFAAGPWMTNEITWNNQPNPYVDGYLAASIGPFLNQFTWRGPAVSLHTYINSIYAGEAANHGFVLGYGSGKHSRGFNSVNTGFTAPRLYLRVNSTSALSDANVTMPAPPADMEWASQVFICAGPEPPDDTDFFSGD